MPESTGAGLQVVSGKPAETPRWLIDVETPVSSPSAPSPAPAAAPKPAASASSVAPVTEPPTEAADAELDAALIEKHRLMREYARSSAHRMKDGGSVSAEEGAAALLEAEAVAFWCLESQRLAAELAGVQAACQSRDAEVAKALKTSGQADLWRALGYSAAHVGAGAAHVARIWLSATIPEERRAIKPSSRDAPPTKAAGTAPLPSELSGSETDDDAPTPRTAARHLDLSTLLTPRAARRRAADEGSGGASDGGSAVPSAAAQADEQRGIEKELRRMEKAASSASAKEVAMREKLDALRRQKEAAERRVLSLANDVQKMQTESDMWREEERRRGGTGTPPPSTPHRATGLGPSPAKSDASSVSRPVVPRIGVADSAASSVASTPRSSRSGLSAREKKDRIAEIQMRLSELNGSGGSSTL